MRLYTNLDSAKHWTATIGFDPSAFFQEVPTGLQTTWYPTVEGKLRFSKNAHHTFTLDYQYMWPIPKENGAPVTYLSLAYAGSIENKQFSATAVPNFFYLSSAGDSGTAASIDLSVMHKKTGLMIGFQMVKSVTVAPFDAKGLYIGYTRTF